MKVVVRRHRFILAQVLPCPLLRWLVVEKWVLFFARPGSKFPFPLCCFKRGKCVCFLPPGLLLGSLGSHGASSCGAGVPPGAPAGGSSWGSSWRSSWGSSWGSSWESWLLLGLPLGLLLGRNLPPTGFHMGPVGPRRNQVWDPRKGLLDLGPRKGGRDPRRQEGAQGTGTLNIFYLLDFLC